MTIASTYPIPIAQVLQARGLRPSPQRIAIFSYVYNSKEHPTVDTVYRSLSPDYPTLSRTTVYQTLETLCECGLVQRISEGGEMRFDAETDRHGHFVCTKCGEISNIAFTGKIPLPLPKDSGYVIKETQIAHRGLCPKCSKT